MGDAGVEKTSGLLYVREPARDNTAAVAGRVPSDGGLGARAAGTLHLSLGSVSIALIDLVNPLRFMEYTEDNHLN
jgi:hypothetical protein